jgi:hypothetical protein
MQGNAFPIVRTTEMQDGTRAYPDARPPPEAERTAFISHQDHRNWRGTPTTTHRETFYPKVAEPIPPVNNQLQDSHGTFGNDAIRERTTLYADSFKHPPPSTDRVDVDAVRAFHMGHHSKGNSYQREDPPRTMHDETFVHHKGVRPSEMCDALKGGHNIVANDPRHVVRESAMKSDFPEHAGVHRPPPVDNLLQRSHLQLTGCGQPWTTTQQDYFQWERYKMPGRPF